MTGGLDELRALLANATPGPWTNQGWDDAEGGSFVVGGGVPGSAKERGIVATLCTTRRAESEANAALIVAAVNALPALLAERELHLAVVDAAEKLIAGAIGDEDTWLNEWCAMFNAVDALKKGNQ